MKSLPVTFVYDTLVLAYCQPTQIRQYTEGLLAEEELREAVRKRFSEVLDTLGLPVFPRIKAAQYGCDEGSPGFSVVEEPIGDTALTPEQYRAWCDLRDSLTHVSAALPALPTGFLQDPTMELKKKAIRAPGFPTAVEIPLGLFTLKIFCGSVGIMSLSKRFQL